MERARRSERDAQQGKGLVQEIVVILVVVVVRAPGNDQAEAIEVAVEVAPDLVVTVIVMAQGRDPVLEKDLTDPVVIAVIETMDDVDRRIYSQ